MKIPEKITNIMAHLIANGYKAYVIGGAVRDYYLGVEPHDYDVFTNCTGDNLLTLFPDSKVLGGEERQAKILTIIVDDVEVSSFRSNGDRTETGNTLEEHQATCDFIINSMVCDINGNIIDFFGGKEDLNKNVLRFVGNPEERIDEDPLRILRGIRFLLKYGLTCDEKTYNLLMETDISHLPKERIKDELIKVLSMEIKDTDFLRMIVRFLPEEISHPNMHLDGGKHHAETPYQHLSYSFFEACKLTSDWRIRLAALLHDVGKATTREEGVKEGVPFVHFYQHHREGSKIVREWMEEMKFSKEDTRFVTNMIYYHMHCIMNTNPSKKSFIKLFNGLEDSGISIEQYMIQIYSDNQGNLAHERIRYGDYMNQSLLLKKYYELRNSDEPFKVRDLKINGNDVMRITNKQGPVIGRILELLLRNVMDNKISNTVDSLTSWVVINGKEIKK